MGQIRYNKCKEKSEKAAKSLHLEMNRMYKYDNGQISLEDFGQPVGMNLKDSNRWVKRAQDDSVDLDRKEIRETFLQ
jgi:hypothetical protein